MPCRSLKFKAIFFACWQRIAIRRVTWPAQYRSIATLRAFSDDIDVFHDREEDVAAAADADAAVLLQAGFSLRWLRREPGIYGAVIERNSESMRLEWARDSDFRFFPTVRDDIFRLCAECHRYRNK